MTDSPEVPTHVAFIPDGNRRYGEREGLPEFEGHRRGLENIERITLCAFAEGVQIVTVYALSLENLLRRSPEEKEFLFDLFRVAFDDIAPKFHKDNIRVRFIGDLTKMPPDIEKKAHDTEQETAGNTGGTFVAALAYGGRDEIIRANRRMTARFLQVTRKEIEKQFPGMHSAGEIAWAFQKAMNNCVSSIGEADIPLYLDTTDLPDVDLLIRTGGEMRISNFLLWQTAYAEYYPSAVYWPAFSEDDLREALRDFANRERRFGGDGAAI